MIFRGFKLFAIEISTSTIPPGLGSLFVFEAHFNVYAAVPLLVSTGLQTSLSFLPSKKYHGPY